MARKKTSVINQSTAKKRQKNSLSQTECITMKHVSTKKKISNSCLNETFIDFLKAEFKENIQVQLKNLRLLKKDTLSVGEMTFKELIMKASKEFLNTPLSMDDETLRTMMSANSVTNVTLENSINTLEAITSISITENSSLNSVRSNMALRKLKKSHSNKIIKGEIRKIRIPEIFTEKKHFGTLASMKRYGITLRRLMKEDEEALSEKGSPLYILSGLQKVPSVNIPLPEGIVMNIEPKKLVGSCTVPELDEKTKSQLRILCQQLKTML